MAANDKMVGGDHYPKGQGEEHWDRMYRMFGRGYFIGSITKYVERFPEKGGIEDLKKAEHFIQKLIELETAKAVDSKTEFDRRLPPIFWPGGARHGKIGKSEEILRRKVRVTRKT